MPRIRFRTLDHAVRKVEDAALSPEHHEPKRQPDDLPGTKPPKRLSGSEIYQRWHGPTRRRAPRARTTTATEAS
jgi:hypothetical protein